MPESRHPLVLSRQSRSAPPRASLEDTFTVQGKGWLPGGTVSVTTIGPKPESTQYDVTSIPIPDSGAWEISLPVTDAALPGDYGLVSSENHEGCELTVTQLFTVESAADTEPPTVSWVKPVGTGESYPATSGTVELEVAVSDNIGIQLLEFYRWDAVNMQLIGLTTDSSAPCQASVEVNALNTEWNEILAVVTDTAGNQAEASIFIYRQVPTITLDPIEGAPGTEVMARGSGWPAGHEVSVQWEDGTELATPTVDESGNFVASFIVPDAAEGEYTIDFVSFPLEGEAYVVSASFTVTAASETPTPEVQPTITLDRTEGPPGTEVTATGSKWSAGLDVSVQWENGAELTTTTVDDNGNFTVSFSVPNDAAEGEYAIDFVSFPPDDEAHFISALFTVTTSEAPSFGPAGSFIPFGCNDGQLCVVHSQAHKEDTGIPTIQYHVHLSRIPKSSLDLADKEHANNNVKPEQGPMLISKMQEALLTLEDRTKHPSEGLAYWKV
jgi:hypothetical protein